MYQCCIIIVSISSSLLKLLFLSTGTQSYEENIVEGYQILRPTHILTLYSCLIREMLVSFITKEDFVDNPYAYVIQFNFNPDVPIITPLND